MPCCSDPKNHATPRFLLHEGKSTETSGQQKHGYSNDELPLQHRESNIPISIHIYTSHCSRCRHTQAVFDLFDESIDAYS